MSMKNYSTLQVSTFPHEGSKGSVDWAIIFSLRLAICILIQFAYAIAPGSFWVYLMLAISLFGLRVIRLRGLIGLIICSFVALSFIWMAAAFLSYTFELAPLKLTDIRWQTLSAINIEIAAFLSAQMVYLFSTLGFAIPNSGRVYVLPRLYWRSIALYCMLITSYIINGNAFIISGGYQGNQNVYWSGFPTIFIVSLAAWTISQKNFGLRYAVILNAIFSYWLLTGNRSEVLMGFIICNGFILFKSKFSRIGSVRLMATVSMLISAFVLFSAIGLIRKQGVESGMLTTIFSSLVQDNRLQISTIGASLYSALSAIDIGRSEGLILGETYLGQFINTIPSFVPVPWERYTDPYFSYSTLYQTIGGYGLIGESYLNFGMAGTIIVSSSIVLFLRYLINGSARSFFKTWLLLSFALYSQRFLFYGYVYMHNLLIFFLFLLLVKTLIEIPSKSVSRH